MFGLTTHCASLNDCSFSSRILSRISASRERCINCAIIRIINIPHGYTVHSSYTHLHDVFGQFWGLRSVSLHLVRSCFDSTLFGITLIISNNNIYMHHYKSCASAASQNNSAEKLPRKKSEAQGQERLHSAEQHNNNSPRVQYSHQLPSLRAHK
jgi:hypothetical protein